MGMIRWDGVYGESDTFLLDLEIAGALQDADVYMRGRSHRELIGELPDMDDARRRRDLRLSTRPDR